MRVRASAQVNVLLTLLAFAYSDYPSCTLKRDFPLDEELVLAKIHF